MNKGKRIVVAITGASGSVYALRTLKMLVESGCEIFCTATEAAKKIAEAEIGCGNFSAALRIIISEEFKEQSNAVKFYDDDDFYAPMASGSFRFDAMCVVPCSMKTLGKIASSISDNLAVRAAEVALKERRRLVVVPRETPLALTHLKAMCVLSEAGATVLPACPAFYNLPKSAEDLADFVAAKILNAMDVKQNFLKEWGNEKKL